MKESNLIKKTKNGFLNKMEKHKWAYSTSEKKIKRKAEEKPRKEIEEIARMEAKKRAREEAEK